MSPRISDQFPAFAKQVLRLSPSKSWSLSMEDDEQVQQQEDEQKLPIVAEIKKEPKDFLQTKYQVDETLKKISSHKGIIGTIITDSNGIPITSTMDSATTAQYASYMIPLATKSKGLIQDIDSTDHMRLLRIRTKLHEIVVVPNAEYYIIVVQMIVIK